MKNGMSVIIPYRNRISCIDKCLIQLLNQSVQFNLEVILVDHCSNDATIQFVTNNYTYGSSLSTGRFKIYKYTRNVGFNLARARNIGIHFASHDLIFTFDIDSICMRCDLLQRLYDDWHWFNRLAKEKGVKALEQFSTPHLTKAEKVDYNIPYRDNGVVLRTVGWGNCLFHKSAFNIVGGLDHNVFCGKGYEDMAFFLLVFRHGFYPVQDRYITNRKSSGWLVNMKDHDLPKNEGVEGDDQWECGNDERALKRSYRQFREIVAKSPTIMHNQIDLEELIVNTERIGV